MPGGHPRIIKTPEELESKIEVYFSTLDGGTPTMSGLAYHLGFAARTSIYEYEDIPEYSYIVKRARLRIEKVYEGELLNKNAPMAGVIFWLKNQGWRDTQTLDDVTKREKPTRIEVAWVDGASD